MIGDSFSKSFVASTPFFTSQSKVSAFLKKYKNIIREYYDRYECLSLSELKAAFPIPEISWNAICRKLSGRFSFITFRTSNAPCSIKITIYNLFGQKLLS